MTTPPEFSRPIAVERIGRDGKTRTIEADAAERTGLARRFDLISLDRLTAEVDLDRIGDGTYRLTATIEAAVVQSCVISLEPVATRIQDRQVHLFAEGGDQDDDVDVDEDAPEPIADGQIDIGEAVAQQLALALPIYPRAPTAAIEAMVEALPDGVTICEYEQILDPAQPDETPAPVPAGAFAALARWKRP